MGNPTTYGVGDSAKKKNTGGYVGQHAKQEQGGVVKIDGEVVFDPSVDAFEILEADGVAITEAEPKGVPLKDQF